MGDRCGKRTAGEQHRNVFVKKCFISTVTLHHKGYNVTGSTKDIHAALALSQDTVQRISSSLTLNTRKSMLENCSLATPDATPELESLAERDHSNRREADSHVRAHLPVRAGLSPSRDLGSLSSDHFDYGLRPQPHIPGSALRHSVVLSSHNMPKILSSWTRLPSSFLPYRHTPAVTISASGLGTKLDPIQLNSTKTKMTIVWLVAFSHAAASFPP
jgi:hypothetical protein